MYDENKFTEIKDIEKEIKPGEIIFADFKVTYRFKNRVQSKNIREGILSRPWESDWPKIDIKHTGVSRWFDRKKIHDITDISVSDIKLRVRTGFKHKPGQFVAPVETKPRRVIEDWEKTERLDNGTFV